MMASTLAASWTVRPKIETQSSERHAGSTPAVGDRPGVGLKPTTWLKAAGTRPDPAVSVPKENGTSPVATATADPEEDPPLMWSADQALDTEPNGERDPTSPVAN